MNHCFVTIIAISFSLGSIHAQQKPTRLFDLSVTSKQQLLDNEGAEIRIKGLVESTSTNATGINFLKFRGASEFSVVAFARHNRNFEKGKPADLYKGKWLEVNGRLQNYRGEPQIRITAPDQVKVLAEPEPSQTVRAKSNPPIEVSSAVGKESDQPSITPVLTKSETETTAPVIEEIDGVPALDWRKFFPPHKDKP